MNDKLETLLKVKSDIAVPANLEEKIMRRIYSERAKQKKGFATIFGILFGRQGRFSYVFASFAVIIIAVSVMFSSGNEKKFLIQKQNEIKILSEEIEMYDAADNIFAEVEKLEEESEKELEEYIALLFS